MTEMEREGVTQGNVVWTADRDVQIAALTNALEGVSAQLNDWQHYASYITNAAILGVPSFAEWKAKQEGAA